MAGNGLEHFPVAWAKKTLRDTTRVSIFVTGRPEEIHRGTARSLYREPIKGSTWSARVDR